MSLPPEIMKELVATFRVDVDDQLQAVSDALLALEKEPDAVARRDTLHGAMRAAHNIKGAARGIGVVEVGAIAHGLETLLTRLMNGDTVFTPAIGDLCFEAVDAIRQALQAFIDETELPFDKKALIGQLENSAEAAEPAPVAIETAPGLNAESPPERGVAPVSPPKPVNVPPARSKGGEVLRISTDKLDRLESLVEEMYASKIDMDDFIGELRPVLAKAHGLSGGGDAVTDMAGDLERVHKILRSRARSLGIALSSMRYEMRTLRLVPAAGLTRPLARSVRDIARQMEKKVSFVTVGEDTEMDRAVMDLLSDPLVHLLRNAIDHGIESPDERAAAGKPETGTIEVSFRLQGSEVLVALKDDGRGIDPAMVRDAAVAKKVISAEQAAGMDRKACLDLIFHPGFSTKKIITDVSGRGVGMDVVRANIQALRGDIRIDTKEGEGSTFTLCVPLTMATDRGLVVRAAGQIFAVPVGNVDRVLDAVRDDLVNLEGTRAVLIDGQPVALRRLAGVLGLQGGDPVAERFPVLIVSSGWRRVALAVDEVAGQREMVIRPLSAPLVSVRGVSGGTLIGGRVRMVLSVQDLLGMAERMGAADGIGADVGGAPAPAAKTILAVDDSLTTRTLVRNVLEAAGYRVTTAVDGQEAWNQMRSARFDLVVTDVEMPVMNGFELTRTIKTSEDFAATPVIIVTSLASESDKQKGIEVGADAYIVKGDFETRVLLDVVEQLI